LENNNFLESYLKPSEEGLDRTFTLPLPDISGLKECGEYIVQGKLDNTCSTNIISKHVSESEGVRLIEVYKNTEDREKGIFIRLVGTLSILKKGYPFLFLDAAISNVSPRSAQQEEISTRVALHMPQANSEERDIFFNLISEKADAANITHNSSNIPVLPDFWGPIWSAGKPGIAPDMIKTLRDMAWASYESFCNQTKPAENFNYMPVQNQMAFKNSAAEHHLFKKMGLSVTAEVQAAFFSVMVAGV
jgi:hypothetical protein